MYPGRKYVMHCFYYDVMYMSTTSNFIEIKMVPNSDLTSINEQLKNKQVNKQMIYKYNDIL